MTLIFVRERNKPWWSLIFLVVFGLSALPSPPVVEQPFVGWLTDRVVATTSFALNSAGIPTRVLGTQMEIGGHLVAVDEACSGIRSLQALGMVALFLGLLFRVRPHVQFGLLGAAFGLSLLFNTFRALGLSWIVFRLGQEGYEQWHDTLGGITFALSSLGLYFLTELSREAPPALKEPRGFVLGPLSWACGLALVLAGGVAEVGSTVWYSWHRRETPAVDWSFRLPDKPRAGYLPEKITDSKAGNVLKFTQGEMGRFQTPQGLRLDVMHLSYAENNSRAWLDLWGYGGHDIDVCMRTLGSQLEAPGPTRILDLGNLRLNVESFRFRHLRNQQIIYVYRIRWTATGDRFDPHSDLREMRLKAVKQGQNNYRSDLIIAGVSGRDLAEPVCYATFCQMIRENLIQ
jgi:exosortase/archaeosortase family protein